jgi:hypothetical protein
LHSALAARELEYVLTVVRGPKSRLKKCYAKICALYTMQQLHARSQKEKKQSHILDKKWRESES